MREVFVVGVHTTPFGRMPEATHKSLTRQAYEGVLADAGLEDGQGIGSAWFGNCALHVFGQANIRGQVCLAPLVQAGAFPERVPVFNVEGGCATGAMALRGAIHDVAAGDAELSLALGVEKTFIPSDPARMFELFDGALDQLDPDTWKQHYEEVAREHGLDYRPEPGRIRLLDIAALGAQFHMRKHGTTARHLAAVAAKNHDHGALNPNAQYRKRMSVEEVLADKAVVGPLTRAMCAPISDGAAAVLVASKEQLARLPAATQARAVRYLGGAFAGGKFRRIDEPSELATAAQRAYARAGVGPERVDVAEVHDATAFAELAALELLGFCAPGAGGALTEEGATRLGGARPVNLSGGLESKGHPLGASGLAMAHEVVTQLRGEAGARQHDGARVGLLQNGGGLIGLDEAASAVMLLARP
jgi:acetyl-CoA acetyltransferase